MEIFNSKGNFQLDNWKKRTRTDMGFEKEKDERFEELAKDFNRSQLEKFKLAADLLQTQEEKSKLLEQLNKSEEDRLRLGADIKKATEEIGDMKFFIEEFKKREKKYLEEKEESKDVIKNYHQQYKDLEREMDSFREQNNQQFNQIKELQQRDLRQIFQISRLVEKNKEKEKKIEEIQDSYADCGKKYLDLQTECATRTARELRKKDKMHELRHHLSEADRKIEDLETRILYAKERGDRFEMDSEEKQRIINAINGDNAKLLEENDELKKEVSRISDLKVKQYHDLQLTIENLNLDKERLEKEKISLEEQLQKERDYFIKKKNEKICMIEEMTNANANLVAARDRLEKEKGMRDEFIDWLQEPINEIRSELNLLISKSK